MFGGLTKEEFKEKQESIVAISGGFDPIHNGHVRLIKEASKHGAVLVILNSDEWLKRKKGYSFMAWDQRAEILMGMKGIYAVIQADDEDGTVCKTLEGIQVDYFANGGDRANENTPELETCVKLGIKPLFNIGGAKVASSSELVSTTSVLRHEAAR